VPAIKLDNENIGGHLTPLQLCTDKIDRNFPFSTSDLLRNKQSGGRTGRGEKGEGKSRKTWKEERVAE